jgi:Bacterial Ig domain
MKLPRKLLKRITFLCLALTTVFLLLVTESVSKAQTRVPSAEPFPTITSSPSPTRTPAPEPFPTLTPSPSLSPSGVTSGNFPISLGGTWLLPVPTTDAGLAKPIVANPDVATVPYEESRSIPVLSNDLGEGLTIIEVSQSEGGTTEINADGTITYGSVGDSPDRFSYKIRDRYGRTATGMVFIELSFAQ